MAEILRVRPSRGLGKEGEAGAKYNLRAEEAHRFRAILGESVERLQLLNLVTADSSRRLASKREPAAQANVRNRKDIVALMVKEKELERQYEHLMHKRWTLKGLSNKSKYLRNQQELKELSDLLVKSSANISQNLKDHPTIVGNINKIQKDRQELEDILSTTVDELHGLTFNSLVEMVHQRTEKQKELFETRRKCDQTNEALKDLQFRLESECERFDQESKKCNETITLLTQKLKHLKKVTRLKLSFERDTAAARAEAKARLQKKELDALRDRIRRAEEGIMRDKFVHEKTVDFLGKQERVMDETEAKWKDKYHEDFKQITQHHEDLKNNQELDFETLNFFEQRWNREMRRQEELKKEAEERERETVAKKRLLKVMALAQCKIRLWWKVHQKHKALAAKKKGKKKSKKKKKKG